MKVFGQPKKTVMLLSSFRPLAGKWSMKALRVSLAPVPKFGCFRPLAGKWSMKVRVERCNQFYILVSVPLRGNGQ